MFAHLAQFNCSTALSKRSARTGTVSILLSAIVMGACADAPTVMPSEPKLRPSAYSSAISDSTDPGIRMRRELRAKSDAELAEEISRAANVVIVGFKNEHDIRGIDSLGVFRIASSRVRELRTTLRGFSKRVIYEFSSIPAVAIELPSASAAVALRKQPWVDYIQANTQGWTTDQSGACSSLSSTQTMGWHLARVQAPEVWGSYTGTNGSLFVLDDGINVSGSTTDLSIAGRFRVAGAPNATVAGAHGTLVASSASARNNSVGVLGIAPDAVLNDGIIYQPNVSLSFQSAAAQLIDGAPASTRVVNISSSSKDTFSSTPPTNFIALYDAITAAVNNRGILFVASTGNTEDPTIFSFPAHFYNVIGVGGTGYSNEATLANYSPGNIEIVAPAIGINVLCPGSNSQGVVDGTSFSTPLVAGALMLLRQKYPTMPYEQVRQRLQSSSDLIPAVSSVRQGWGLLNVNSLVNLVEVTTVGPRSISTPGVYTFEAIPSAGNGTYTYEWWGYDASLDEYVALGTTKSITTTYSVGSGFSWYDVTVRSNGKVANVRHSLTSRP
jgi:Subtilase family